MIRVLVAEDSRTVSELLVDILQSDPEVRVVGLAWDGLEAVALAAQLRPDVITMDLTMPKMDGFQATRRIMSETPTPIVVVSSHPNAREVELTIEAMRAGALMVVESPGGAGFAPHNGGRDRLLATVKAMARVDVTRSRRPRAPQPASAPPRDRARSIRLVAVASSTGGPAALQGLLGGLGSGFPAPILAIQHIAPGFVDGLARWLDAGCQLRVKVAELGESLAAGTVYLAPDGVHLGVTVEGRVELVGAEPIGGFRPSGTHLFESAARAYGRAFAAVVLTGMGRDGVDGLKAVKGAGGLVLAQDEASSVVYGMPQEAVRAGVVDIQLPVAELAAELVRAARRRE